MVNGKPYWLYAKDKNEQDTLVGKPEEDRPFERSTRICQIILKRILKRITRVTWLVAGRWRVSVSILMNFWLQKMPEISWITERLSAPEEGLSLFSWLQNNSNVTPWRQEPRNSRKSYMKLPGGRSTVKKSKIGGALM